MANNIIQFNNQSFSVDERVSGFTLLKKQSSNVDFFGYNADQSKVLIQFKGGNCCYMYSEVPADIITGAITAQSIGGYVSANIANHFPAEKINERLIRPASTALPANTTVQ